MFNVVAKPKPGECVARRCKQSSDASGLCPRHFDQWEAEGRPELSSAPAQAPANTPVPPDVAEALEKQRADAEASLQLIKSFEVVDQTTMDQAAEMRRTVRKAREALEEQRTAITRPMNAALRRVNDLFRPLKDYYEACEKALKGKIDARINADRQSQQEALEKVEANGGHVDSETLVVAHGADHVEPSEGVSVRHLWRYSIVDESQIPRQFLEPNHKLIQGYIDSRKSEASIPGIKIYSVASSAVRL